MLPFRKILFPVDYSEPCLAVVPYVKDMQRRFPSDVTLVHAYGPATAFALAQNDFVLTDPNLPAEVQAIEEQRLRDFARKMFPDQHVEALVELGEPGTVVHDVARRQGADLVMLATRGQGPVRRFLLGSVTAKVLHDMTTAVWTGVGSALAGHAPRIPYQSIVCALDDGDEAEAVLKAAAAFASACHAQLSLLHVVQMPVSAEVDLTPYKKDLDDAANFRLRELKSRLGIDAPQTVVDAGIADGVRQEVLRRKADLVITGRGHVHGAFSRMWSHLYPIVRESPCPVLSI